jgi:transketolase
MPVEKLGLQDCFGESGKPEQLFEKYSMDVDSICKAAKKVIERKNV